MFVNGVATPINIDGVRWDRRCGPDYPSIQDGVTSGKCDPNGPNPCCSEFGWCGPESDFNKQDHCSCDNCVDFRTFPAFDIAGKPGVNGGGPSSRKTFREYIITGCPYYVFRHSFEIGFWTPI